MDGTQILTFATGALSIFVLTNVLASVWWASKINTLLGIVQSKLDEIVIELKASHEVYFTKAEALRELAIAEKEHRALWKRFDEIAVKVEQK